jgi:hypothetical protein
VIHDGRDSAIDPRETLLVEHDVEQGAVNLQPAVVVDKTKLSEAIHREVHSGSSASASAPTPAAAAMV